MEMKQNNSIYIIILLLIVVVVGLLGSATYKLEMFENESYLTDFNVRVVQNKKDSRIPNILVQWTAGWEVEVFCEELNAKEHDPYKKGYRYTKYDNSSLFENVYTGEFKITVKVLKDSSVSRRVASNWHVITKNVTVPGPAVPTMDIRLNPKCKLGGRCDVEVSWDGPSYQAEITYENNTYKVTNTSTSYTIPNVDLSWPRSFYVAVQRYKDQPKDSWINLQRSNVSSKTLKIFSPNSKSSVKK